MTIKIVRKYDIIKNKDTRFQQTITIGLDNSSNIFGFCQKCKKNMARSLIFDVKLKKKITKLKCKACGVSVEF